MNNNDDIEAISIDGCHSGWFYVPVIDTKNWKVGIVKNINELKGEIETSKYTLIDIPIGLRGSGRLERLCDLEARKILTKRKSSIFPAPHKLSLKCSSYIEACNVNFINFGRKLSKQSWSIISKIKEVNDFIVNNNFEGKVREIHPEICFWALNRKSEMLYNKKTIEGFQERLKLLSQYIPFVGDIVDYSLKNYKRKDLAKDDILDALSGIAVAQHKGPLKTTRESRI